MSRSPLMSTRAMFLGLGLLVLSACATAPPPAAPLDSRVKLNALQSDPQLATRAPVEMKAAEAAVTAAEAPREDERYANHLMLLADQKVEIARARAQSRLYEDQRQALSERSEGARLDARTQEADRAISAGRAARADAASARSDAASARDEVAAARSLSRDLQRQITELNARETDRGLVVTLGDLLFATGQSSLAGSAGANLDRLADFLAQYGDRSVLIEGHTDSVGSAQSNLVLSQRRAESVKSYLVSRGVAAQRLTTAGLGEVSPVASNDSATGRRQNRRVEVIISDRDEQSLR